MALFCACLGQSSVAAVKLLYLVDTVHTCTWLTVKRTRTSTTTRSIIASNVRQRFMVRVVLVPGVLCKLGPEVMTLLFMLPVTPGTHFTNVRNNVAFHVRGHTYFVEDGGEMYNNFENNLAAFTLCSEGPLKGDSHPAQFWTSSPMNIWRHNVAAGSCGFGYWFELPGNPGGESSSPDVCCRHNPVGGVF